MIKSKTQGQVIVISSPSGGGKGTVIAELLKRNKNLWLSVSTTSREIRTNDIPGVTYNFISKVTSQTHPITPQINQVLPVLALFYPYPHLHLLKAL